MPEPELEHKTAIVTGASSGIGQALALALLAAGAKVCLAARRLERLEAMAADYPQTALAVAGDVTRPADRATVVDAALAAWGHIDLLVNNAGLGAYGGFLETGLDEWKNLFEVNLFAPVALTQLALPHMLARGRGAILNVASIGGLVAHSDKVTPYVSSKHAVLGFTRGLARDLAGTGISVKAACPHLTDTEFFSTGPGAGEMAGEIDKYRGFMDTPQEVANGILAGLAGPELVIFPTEKPARAFAKMRDV